MATPTDTTPAPSSTKPAKSISPSELANELRPKPEKAIFSEPGNTTRIGGEPGKIEENEIPSFGKAAREMMAKKAAEEAAPAPVTQPDPNQPLKGERVPPSSERKVEAKAAPAAKEEPAAAPAKTDEDPPEDERRVLPHDKPATAKRIGYFLRNEAALKKERDELKSQLDAAKKAPPTVANAEEVTKLREEYQKASDELGRFRRRYDLDNDPTFKAKYDEPVGQIDKGIEDTLKRVGFADATLAAIKAEGGFGAFSRSGKQFTVTEETADGPKKVSRTAAELARQWLGVIPVDDAEFIKAGIGRQRLLSEERKAAIETESANFKKWEEERKAGATQATAQQQEEMKKATEEFSNWQKTTLESTDWLKDKDIPENATAEQRKEIEEHNEFTQQLRDGLQKHPKNAKDYMAMIFDATHSHHLRRELGSAEARIKALESQLSRATAATRTTGKAGSLLTGSAPKAEVEDKNADPTDITKALRRGRDRIVSGNADE